MTTGILWVAGIALVVVGSSRRRFDRLLSWTSNAWSTAAGRAADAGDSKHPLTSLSMALTFAIGCVCIVLAVLGTWTQVR